MCCPGVTCTVEPLSASLTKTVPPTACGLVASDVGRGPVAGRRVPGEAVAEPVAEPIPDPVPGRVEAAVLGARPGGEGGPPPCASLDPPQGAHALSRARQTNPPTPVETRRVMLPPQRLDARSPTRVPTILTAPTRPRHPDQSGLQLVVAAVETPSVSRRTLRPIGHSSPAVTMTLVTMVRLAYQTPVDGTIRDKLTACEGK